MEWQNRRPALASADVGLELLDELKTQGYERTTVERFVRMGNHGVRADYVRGMASAGYRLGSIDELVRMRDHGVAPDFVRTVKPRTSTAPTPDELIRLKDRRSY
ncbi:MAG: hypothetical protein LC795_18815 [Acidobacteria bacterium]|nr:hypothetical protein [Acidobacteriota bacterium]